MKRPPTTAAELMAEMESDPAWVAARDQREAERVRNESELRSAAAPLIADLRALGYEVESEWDLVNTRTPYASALPVLLAHLQRQYPVPVREGIARALAVPEAKFAWPTLLQQFRAERDERVKNGLAVALAVAAAGDGDAIRDLVLLASDPSHGTSRILLLEAIARSPDPQAQTAFTSFAQDPVLEKEVALIVKRRRQRRRSSTD